MRLSLAAAIAALALVPAPALAQEPPAERQAVGFYVSNIAGSGLTYFKSLGNGWGFHVSGIGWGQGGSAFFNAGGAVTRDLDYRPWGTLYAFGGLGAGLGTFMGGGGLAGGSNLQLNVTPGVGFTWGPIALEFGYSVFHNQSGIGFGPAGGAGLVWWF